MYDSIIIGGGPAGLSAALVLGRARRRVLLLSDGPPRNAPAEAAHGFFTRDGTPPLELLRIGHEQLAAYETVEVRKIAATAAEKDEDGFIITLADGQQLRSRTLGLTTGIRDELPEIPGFNELWGRGVYHCPYCHGWEVRDQRLAVFAKGDVAMHLAPLIRNWSRDITLITNGPSGLTDVQRTTLERLEIPLNETPVSHLNIESGALAAVAFTDGTELRLDGIFAATTLRPNNDLARQLGCDLVTEGMLTGHVTIDQRGQTSVPGVFAAGDVTTVLQQVVTAASSGALIGAQINFALVEAEIREVSASVH